MKIYMTIYKKERKNKNRDNYYSIFISEGVKSKIIEIHAYMSVDNKETIKGMEEVSKRENISNNMISYRNFLKLYKIDTKTFLKYYSKN